MTIKAIQTEYRGYKFRSRLEARWAVFFDTAGIKWEYEKEGFDLGKYGYYLPDFYLPDLDCYIEIKPESGMTSEAEDKLRALSNGIPVICFQGLPSLSWKGYNGGTLFCWDTCDSGGGAYQNEISWTYCGTCNKVTLSIADNDNKILRGDRTLFKDECFQKSWTEICDPEHRDTYYIGDLDERMQLAKSARFEHGETPRIELPSPIKDFDLFAPLDPPEIKPPPVPKAPPSRDTFVLQNMGKLKDAPNLNPGISLRMVLYDPVDRKDKSVGYAEATRRKKMFATAMGLIRSSTSAAAKDRVTYRLQSGEETVYVEDPDPINISQLLIDMLNDLVGKTGFELFEPE